MLLKRKDWGVKTNYAVWKMQQNRKRRAALQKGLQADTLLAPDTEMETFG